MKRKLNKEFRELNQELNQELKTKELKTKESRNKYRDLPHLFRIHFQPIRNRLQPLNSYNVPNIILSLYLLSFNFIFIMLYKHTIILIIIYLNIFEVKLILLVVIK